MVFLWPVHTYDAVELSRVVRTYCQRQSTRVGVVNVNWLLVFFCLISWSSNRAIGNNVF